MLGRRDSKSKIGPNVHLPADRQPLSGPANYAKVEAAQTSDPQDYILHAKNHFYAERETYDSHLPAGMHFLEVLREEAGVISAKDGVRARGHMRLLYGPG